MTRPSPETDYHITREQVVHFVMEKEAEPREYATKRVRRTKWGYEVQTQTLHYILTKDINFLTYGNGPILVNGTTGLCTALSSNPDDMFGTCGYTSLHTPDDLAKLELVRGCEVGRIEPLTT